MKFWLLCAYMFYFSGHAQAVAYDGDNILSVIGQHSSSATYKAFSKFWLLNKENENRARGIRVYFNPIADTAESIIITGYTTDLSTSKYAKCSAELPMQITLDDDTISLAGKLGHGEKLPGRNTWKFHKDNIGIEATYGDLKNGKIAYLKFGTYVPTIIEEPVIAPVIKKESIADKSQQLEKDIFLTTDVSHAAVPKVKDTIVLPPLKKAMLDIFKASKEFAFLSIKTDERTEKNFWNYKYTYHTSIKVPGEKYNMLYSFPFPTSQLDFVVVLKESDKYDKSFETIYHSFEKQLAENFPESDGWISTCLPDKDKNPLPDLEFRNDKYGAIILDHTRSPAGKHVLYLRFLLFAD
jgi:hypothetical protein